MSTALRCAGLGHRYGRKIWGLRDCDLDVPAGRVVALIGPNGSGKTTLMSMAAGLLPATAGTVEAAGGAPAQRLDKIGFLAQDAPLWPRLRVADVLEIGRCMNRGFDAAMAGQRIRRLSIRPRARIGTLSGGERAQVALTLVLAKKPELFLLDEPTANLDPLARREFLGSMFEACTETGATVLYSSHAVAELERICDYLIVLHGGHTAGRRHRRAAPAAPGHIRAGRLARRRLAGHQPAQHGRPDHGAGALRRRAPRWPGPAGRGTHL